MLHVQVECCSCGKWRQVPAALDLGEEDDVWVCAMQSPDHSCADSQGAFHNFVVHTAGEQGLCVPWPLCMQACMTSSPRP